MGKPDRNLFRGYWNLDEAGGSNAIDSTSNGNDLTETSGTIASSDGGRLLVAADTEYFVIADNASLSFADEAFTVGCWVKLTSQTADRKLLSKYNYGAGRREYELEYDNGTDRYRWRVAENGTTGHDLAANDYGAVPATTKAFVLAWHDPVANTINIQINNGTVTSAAHTTGCNDNSSPFAIGVDFNGATPNGYGDQIQWSTFVYAGVMTTDERTWMYNAGVPRKWNEIGLSGIKTINGVPMNNISTINGKPIQYINSINNAS